MKYSLCLILSCLLLSVQSQINTSREEITPFIITSVILKDTAYIKNMPVYYDTPSEYMTLYQYNQNFMNPERYLSPRQFSNFCDMIWEVVKSPKSKVYIYPKDKAATNKILFKSLVLCDSIFETSYDPQGYEITIRRWMCDSLSKIQRIQRIDFYETWYFNKATNMIERETLGYRLWEYKQEIPTYNPLFYVFRDEKATQKARKFLAY